MYIIHVVIWYISYCISWHPLLKDGKVISDIFSQKTCCARRRKGEWDIRVNREACIWAAFVTMVKHQASRFSIDVPVVRRPVLFGCWITKSRLKSLLNHQVMSLLVSISHALVVRSFECFKQSGLDASDQEPGPGLPEGCGITHWFFLSLVCFGCMLLPPSTYKL